MQCPTCGKECASEFGLKSHMRSHKDKPAEPPKDQPKTASQFVLQDVAGGWGIWKASEAEAYVADADGKRLTPIVTLERAEVLRGRWINHKR